MTNLLHNLELVEFRKNEITVKENVYNFESSTRKVFVQCLVAPNSTGGEDLENEMFTLYLFESVDVEFFDEVVLRGKIGVVEGSPRVWMAPTSKKIKGVEIRVRIIGNEKENAYKVQPE